MNLDKETIVALATPPGEGAIGIIRLSGKDAISIAEKIFSGKKLSEQASHTVHFGKIISDEIVDEVLISLFRTPKSYTGEDVVEISCHGSRYILEKIIALCCLHGAVVARPGEFTQRAFLNGKMDLTQAEAVADLIASESGAAHHAAMHQLRGGFSHDLKRMREQLINFSALIELELDFSQEDVAFADREKLYALIEELTRETNKLIESFHLGNAIKQGVRVAIIGRPNAGKSTLLNALLNEERAIVSEIAGTTRDTIEETMNIHGVLFRLIDTAGIREHTADVIESIGIERSKKAMESADVIIHLMEPDAAELMQTKYVPVIHVINKEDLLDESEKKNIGAKFPQTLFISAKQGAGIQQLKQRLYELAVGDQIHQEGTIVTSTRHLTALKQVMQSLQDIKKGMDKNLSGELIALDIRQCLFHLGTITGEVQLDRDILGTIFGKFCIGK